MSSGKGRNPRNHASHKKQVISEDTTVEVVTVEAGESTAVGDNAEQSGTTNNATSMPDENANKDKMEAQKQPKLKQFLNLNEPEEKTRFEKVNVVARPAVSRGRKRSSLRWKNNSRFEERPSREKHIGTINERTKTPLVNILNAETDRTNMKDEPEERTKFEFVDVKRRPAISRGRRKRSLKWKKCENENNARNVNEPATYEETVTQDQGESQDDSAAATNTAVGDNAEQSGTTNNATSMPDENANKDKMEAQKQPQLKQFLNLNEPEEKTRFEKVNVVARPAVSRGRKRSSLRWKNNSRFEERPSREKHIGTINERTKTPLVNILNAETDRTNMKDEPEERTKFEFVDVKRRPAISRGRRKRSLKWKKCENENNARNVNEPATYEETVTQDQGESQDDSAAATNGGQKHEMVHPDSWPSLGKHRKKGHLKSKGGDREQRRKSYSSTTEDESTPDGSTDNDGDKLVTQEEVEKGSALSNTALRMEPKISISRSVRALELIRNATLLEGVLSDKENALVAAFFANPTTLTANIKRLVKKALIIAMERLKKVTTDDQLNGLFDDRDGALDEMMQDLLVNKSLLPSCWVQITGNEKNSTTGSSITPSQTSSGKKLAKASKPNELENPVVMSSPKVVKSPEKSRGVMKVFERSTWNKSLRSWRKSEKSRKSEKKERRRKDKEENKEQKNVVLDEREKKAWREAEAERTSFLAFALPAAYRFFGFK